MNRMAIQSITEENVAHGIRMSHDNGVDAYTGPPNDGTDFVILLRDNEGISADFGESANNPDVVVQSVNAMKGSRKKLKEEKHNIP